MAHTNMKSYDVANSSINLQILATPVSEFGDFAGEEYWLDGRQEFISVITLHQSDIFDMKSGEQTVLASRLYNT